MMQPLQLYAITVIIFLVLDAVGIKFMIRPVFEQHVGHLLAEQLRLLPALSFYLTYVAGLIWMVSMPALRDAAPLQALIGGMVLGFLCYSTYEMTNFATLADWSIDQVLIDVGWGTVLTGFSAWAGVAIITRQLA